MGRAMLCLAASALGCGRFGIDPRPDAPPDAADPACTSTDLVACYLFEGSAVDVSTTGNDLIASGVTYVPGHAGQGAQVVAGSSLVAVEDPSFDLTAGMSIDAWIYLDTLPVGTERSGVVDNNNQWGMFVVPGGDVRCSAGIILAGAAAIPAATWTHVACTFDGAELAIWRDGTKLAGAALAPPLLTNGTDGVRIGGNTADQINPNPDPFVGVLDSLRIWRTALSPQALCAEAGTCP